MTGQPKPQLAFLGIGLMGSPMATRLLAAGYSVTVWNRSGEKARALAAKGAKVANTPAEAVADADFVVTMLFDGQAVTDVLFAPEMTAALRSNATIIDMSSIPPRTAREHAGRFQARGIAYLDAPVSGGVRGATDGTLAIMAGGEAAVFEKATLLLEALGRPTRVGPNGSGQLAKLANQAIVGVTIGAVAEALLLVSSGGADPAKVRDALSGGFADSAILRQHGERMLERNWLPGGPIRLQVKDLRNVLSEAAELGLDLPIVSCVAALFEKCVEMGLGEYDHSALLLEIERHNHGARLGTKPDRAPTAKG